MLSVIITTYNRATVVQSSIQSALLFCAQYEGDEIVIIDDDSSDRTVEVIQKKYANEIKAGYIKLSKLSRNIGATGAKNAGAAIASNNWLIFLDSDDQLISEAATCVRSTLKDLTDDAALVFFRCRSQEGSVIGRNVQAMQQLHINEYIRNGTYGESLPVVRREVFSKHTYPEDLRGFEGLTYFNILAAGYKVYLSAICARTYTENGADSLSRALSLGSRSQFLIIGHYRILRIGFLKVNFISTLITASKLMYHILRYTIFAMRSRKIIIFQSSK
jgi:glycosyltransferase involved in cell wall biosynthesis